MCRKLTAPGFGEIPDRAAWLRLFIAAYGLAIDPAGLVGLAIVRLMSIAEHIEQEIRGGNPAFVQHLVENRGAGYRAAAPFVLAQRDGLLDL